MKTKLVVFLIVFIDLLGLGLVIPVLPLILLKETFLPGFSQAAIDVLLGLLIATYPLCQFLATPILGKLSDRFGRKPILAISLVGTFVGYIVFALGIVFANIFLLFIGRVIDGLTGGNVSVATAAIADVSKAKDKAKNFGLIGMAFGMGFIFGPFIGGVLSDHTLVSWFTLATPFWFAAALVLVNLVMLWRLFTETLVKRSSTRIKPLAAFSKIAKVFSYTGLGIVFVVLFLVNFGWAFFTQFFQVFLFSRFALSPSRIGYVFAYLGVCVALAQGVLIRPVSHRFSPKVLLRISIPLTAVVLLLLAFAHSLTSIYLLIPLLAIFFGFVQPNFSALLSNSVSENTQGEILGVRQSVVSLAQVFPPIIAGFAIAINASLPVLLASCVIFAAAILFALPMNRAKLIHRI